MAKFNITKERDEKGFCSFFVNGVPTEGTSPEYFLEKGVELLINKEFGWDSGNWSRSLHSNNIFSPSYTKGDVWVGDSFLHIQKTEEEAKVLESIFNDFYAAIPSRPLKKYIRKIVREIREWVKTLPEKVEWEFEV